MKSKRSFRVSNGSIVSGMVLTNSRIFCAKVLLINVNPININKKVLFISINYVFLQSY